MLLVSQCVVVMKITQSLEQKTKEASWLDGEASAMNPEQSFLTAGYISVDLINAFPLALRFIFRLLKVSMDYSIASLRFFNGTISQEYRPSQPMLLMAPSPTDCRAWSGARMDPFSSNLLQLNEMFII